jgi:hypothetical protein
VEGAPDAYADAATALDSTVDGVPAAFALLCTESGFGTARSRIDANFVADDIAATMVAVENQPMLHNNARPVSEADRRQLAERTAGVWNLDRP